MTITATELPVLPLTPTGDSGPVLQALIRSIADGHPPETWLWINQHKPCGGVSVHYAWTDGGTSLADRIDTLALAAGLDSADWMHITSEHAQVSTRGRIEILAHPLRPILADVQAGLRCPDARRACLDSFLDRYAAETGQARVPGVPRWVGVGPELLARRTP